MPNLEDIASARTQAQTLGAQAGEAQAGTFTVGDLLKEKATEAYKASQDIVQPLDVATQEYLGAPQVAREKYQNIWNPFSREKLISEYVSDRSLPMLSLQSMLGQRFGSIGDIISKGTNAYQAQATAIQNKAQLARQLYSDIMSEYQLQQEQEQAAEEQQRWEWEQPYKERTYEYNLNQPYYKPESNSSNTFEQLILDYLNNQQQNDSYFPDEPMPTGIPSRTDIPFRSPQGQWMFDPQYQTWVPITD